MKYSTQAVFAGAALVVSLASSYALVTAARAYGASAVPFRTISVQAEGEAVAIPDTASFTFGVVTEGGTDIAALQEENAGKGNAILSYLRDQGLPDEDVKTVQYAIEPRYRSCDPWRESVCPPREITGYTVRQSVRVKTGDLARAGELLAGVAERGANTVSALSFDVEDIEAFREKARERAIASAKEKGKNLASAGGLKLGRLLTIRESQAFPAYARTYADEEMSIGGAAPEIRPGSQEITVSVALEYEVR